MRALITLLIVLPFCAMSQTPLSVEYLPNLNYARAAHQQIAVDQTRFIVTGGHVNGFYLTQNAEIYDANAKSWQVASTSFSHDMGFIARLNNGKYLIGAGCSSGYGVGQHPNCEVYDPVQNTFTPVASMNVARTMPTAATLNDGRVLVVGNWYASASNAEVYDPEKNTFTLTGACLVARANPIIIPTDDGGAIVCGGSGIYGGAPGSYIFEKYDPVNNSFSELTHTLFDGETSWDIVSGNSFMTHQLLLPNGCYAVPVYNIAGTSFRLISIDPATSKIEEIKTKTPIPLTDETNAELKYACSRIPMIDLRRNLLHIVQHSGTTANIILRIVTVNLKTGEITTSKKDGFNHSVVSSNLSMLPDGRILFTGGHKFDNFNLSESAFIVTPGYFSTNERVCELPFVYHNYFDLNGSSGFNSFKKSPLGGYDGIAWRNLGSVQKIELVHFDENGKFLFSKTIRNFPYVYGSSNINLVSSDIDEQGGWYILTGIFNPGTQWNELLHINAIGDSLWNIVVSEKGEWSSQPLSYVKSFPGGGCVVSGSTSWFPTTPKISKISKEGVVKWTSTNFPSTDVGYSKANSVAINQNGEIFVTGKVHNNLNARRSMFISKLDSLGTKQWTNEYYSGLPYSGDSIFGWGSSITNTDDGGCIVGGYMSVKGKNDGTGGAFLKKIDAAGNALWEHKYFPNGYYPDVLKLLKLNESNKYIAYIHQVSGSTSPIPTVLKFSDSGDSLWIQQGYDYRVSMSANDDNDNLLFCAASPFAATNWENQGLVYRTTSDGLYQGTELWAYPYDNEVKVSLTPTIGWSSTSHIGTYTLQIATDSLFNNVAYEGTGILPTNNQFTYHTLSKPLNPMTKYFSRVQLVGVQGCTSAWSAVRRFTTLDNTAVDQHLEDNLKIYPNPASTVITIEYPDLELKNVVVEISDITGKIIRTHKAENCISNKIIENVSDLSVGIYFCKLVNEKNIQKRMFIVNK